VTLTFMSGGRQPLRGRARLAASTGILVRALLIGSIGLALGYTEQAEVILLYYAVLFVLALPLLGLRSWAFGLLAAALLVVSPAMLVLTFGAGLPVISSTNPTFATVVQNPLGLLSEVFLTGPYPAITYLVYLLVGLAIGRSDLTSVRVAQWLAGGGVALAVVSWSASALLLTRLGGAEALRGATGTETDPAKLLDVLNWHPVRPPRRTCGGWRCARRTRTPPWTWRRRSARPWRCSASPCCCPASRWRRGCCGPWRRPAA